MPDESSPLFLTVKEAALLLRVNTHLLYRQLEKGEIPGAIRIGALWRIRRDALVPLPLNPVPPEPAFPELSMPILPEC